MQHRKPFEGEEYNEEAGYLVIDNGMHYRDLENLAEMLNNKFGITLTEIDTGWSDYVIQLTRDNL